MAATSVNIGGGDDQFNRYKMPSVIAKVEGRGNGIKTRIVNCFEVARALHRPPGYVCKFFGCELGAQTKIDDGEGTYIVNGSFQQSVLMEVLSKFIEMFVLCSSCKLPETDLKLRKHVINQVCNACGTTAPVDMTHKLCTYIINNPPDGKKKKSDGKKDKAARRAAKAKKANGEVEDDSDKNRRKEAKKAAKKIDEEETIGLAGDFDFIDGNGFNGTINDVDDDDVEWSVDTSKEAEEARRRELGAAASILERAPVQDENENAKKLRNYINEGKKPAKVLAKAEKIFGGPDSIRGLMMAVTFGEKLGDIPSVVKEIAIPVFERIGAPMPEEAQQAFLSYLDWVGGNDEKMLDVLPHMLQYLYEADVLEEKEIMKWFNSDEGREDVRNRVQVIIDWLNEEDDDDSDDDDSDE